MEETKSFIELVAPFPVKSAQENVREHYQQKNIPIKGIAYFDFSSVRHVEICKITLF